MFPRNFSAYCLGVWPLATIVRFCVLVVEAGGDVAVFAGISLRFLWTAIKGVRFGVETDRTVGADFFDTINGGDARGEAG